MRAMLIGAAVAAASLVAAPAAADSKSYAIVVAHTDDITRDLPPLQYADDDGARYYELLSQVADRVTLFTILDADSQRLYPKVAGSARVPRRADVLNGVARTFEQIERDVAAGHEVTFYFVLVGHGDVGAGGEGYVSLLDSPFTRTDLFQEVLARSPATTNHVIIDACNSYFMVHRRGGAGADDAGPSRPDAVKSFLRNEELSRYPNTGFLLSTSAQKDSHEWSAYGAGVFSHQLRSALVGGADVSGDGRIDYSEVEAFVAAANLRVDDPRARIELFARPPAIDLSRPLVDLSRTRFRHWLRVPKGTAARVYLEDARGVRYADLHTSGEHDTVLGLVSSAHYYVRSSDGRREARLTLDRPGRFDVDPASMTGATIAARGAVAEAFRVHLYEEPFGPSFYRGYVASKGLRAAAAAERMWLPEAAVAPPEAQPLTVPSAEAPAGPLAAEPAPTSLTAAPRRSSRRTAAWVTTAGTIALAGAGGFALYEGAARERTFFADHIDAEGNLVGISRADARVAERSARRWQLAGGILMGLAGAAGVTATILFAGEDEARPAGVSVGGSF